MLKVKEFQDLGVEFVEGDKIQWRHGNAVGVISFAWRPLSALSDNPKFKYEQDFTKAEIMWRPPLDQSEVAKPYDFAEHVSGMFKDIKNTEFKIHEDSEIATTNPVFTQAMADKGELPPVGSSAMFDSYGNSDYLNEYELGLSDGDEVEIIAHFYAGESMVAAFTYSIPHGKLVSQSDASGFKPVDTRTPKQKAVDAAALAIEMKHGGAGGAYKKYCETLYDAGLLIC